MSALNKVIRKFVNGLSTPTEDEIYYLTCKKADDICEQQGLDGVSFRPLLDKGILVGVAAYTAYYDEECNSWFPIYIGGFEF
jgi:hypothetical protein